MEKLFTALLEIVTSCVAIKFPSAETKAEMLFRAKDIWNAIAEFKSKTLTLTEDAKDALALEFGEKLFKILEP
jgi:hypothetical protein